MAEERFHEHNSDAFLIMANDGTLWLGGTTRWASNAQALVSSTHSLLVWICTWDFGKKKQTNPIKRIHPSK